MIKILPLAVLLALSPPVFAEKLTNLDEYSEVDDYFDDFYGSEEMVEIATGSKKQFHLLPSVASIITSQDIDEMGALYLSEVLESVPGLHVIPSASTRLTPTFSVRGVHTGFNPQILVLMNGTEFKHPTSSALTYSFRYPVQNIERIEVIRGPGSAIYGADAYSGVINIITKKPVKNTTANVGITAGTFSTSDIWANINWVKDDLKVGLSINKYKTDGDKDRIISSDLQTNFDGIFGTSASLAPNYLPTQADVTNMHFDLMWKGWTMENWYWSLKNAGQGNGATQTLDHGGEENADSSLSKLSNQTVINENWQLNSNISHYKTEADSFLVLFPENSKIPIGDDGNLFTPNLPGVEGGGLVSFTEGVIGNPIPSLAEIRINFAGTYSGVENHYIRMGAGWVQSKLTAEEFKNFGPGILDGERFRDEVDGTLTNVTGTENIYVNDKTRKVNYFTLQDEWKIANDLELTLGLRYDDYSDFGDTVNPRAALVWQTRHNLTTKLMYGSAFRAPSFSELFLINNPASLGNKNLKPEEIDTYELVFDYRPSLDTKLSANFFKYKATDLIVRVKDQPPATTTTSQNVRDLDGNGFELEFNWKISENISWDSSFSYQNAEDNELKTTIADTPSKQFYTDLRMRIYEDWKVTAQLNYVMDRSRVIGDKRSSLDDYTVINLTAIYLPINNIEFKFSIKNLLDESYYESTNGTIPDDIPMEGRSMFATATYSF